MTFYIFFKSEIEKSKDNEPISKETSYNQFIEFFDSFLNFCEHVLYNENESKLPSGQIIAEILESEFLSQPDSNKISTNSAKNKKQCDDPHIKENLKSDSQAVKALYLQYDAVK